MVLTLPTAVCVCMREDLKGYRAARLSSESSNIVKISILHSMKLCQTHPVVGIHNSFGH